MIFTCATCGRQHDLREISFGADRPAQWDLLDDAERRASLLGEEQCTIEADGQRSFYVRGCLEVPIRGTDHSFTWGVWCSLSERSYNEVVDHWDDPQRTAVGPHFGWLCTPIPAYPDTMFLKALVHQRPPGQRPTVELEARDHPLALHQRDGIELSELETIVTQLLHAHHP